MKDLQFAHLTRVASHVYLGAGGQLGFGGAKGVRRLTAVVCEGDHCEYPDEASWKARGVAFGGCAAITAWTTATAL